MAKSVRLAGLVAIAALTFATSASAATVFFQDFNSITPNTLSLTTLPGFTVAGSTVDVVGASNPYGITGITSNVVDLDGTPGPATIISSPSSFAYNAGDIVTLSLLLGGAQRQRERHVCPRIGIQQSGFGGQFYRCRIFLFRDCVA
jgi:hypothetical protein